MNNVLWKGIFGIDGVMNLMNWISWTNWMMDVSNPYPRMLKNMHISLPCFHHEWCIVLFQIVTKWVCVIDTLLNSNKWVEYPSCHNLEQGIKDRRWKQSDSNFIFVAIAASATCFQALACIRTPASKSHKRGERHEHDITIVERSTTESHSLSNWRGGFHRKKIALETCS